MTLPTFTAEQFIQQTREAFPVAWAADSAHQDGGGLYAIEAAEAAAAVAVYALLVRVEQDVSITTATSTGLDTAVQERFNNALPRYLNESDTSYRDRALAFSQLGHRTEAAMTAGVELAVGTTPTIRTARHGSAYAGGYSSYASGTHIAGPYGPLAWDVGGEYYRPDAPYQAWIDIQQLEPADPKFLSRRQILETVYRLTALGVVSWVKVIGPASTSGVPIE